MNLAIGNLEKDSFRELWISSSVLNNLRSRDSYTGRCGHCRLWAFCRGYRAVARAGSDNEKGYLVDDPHCWLDHP